MLLVAIPIIILVVFFMAPSAGLLTRQQSGGFVNWLAKVLEKTPIFAGLFTIEDVVRLDRWVTHELGKAFKAVEHAGLSWLAALAHYVDVVGYWSLYWPIALVHEVRHLTAHTIPRAITARVKPLDRRIDVAEATAKAAAGVAHSNTVVIRKGGTVKEVTRIERVAMPHAQEWDWIHKHWQALTAAVIGAAALPTTIALEHPASLPVPFGRTVKQIRRRLGRIEALIGVTAFAAVLAQTLGVSLRCVGPSGNLARLARSICRAPSWLIRFLVAGAVEAFILSDLCRFTTLMYDEAVRLRPALLAIVDVENALVDCGDNSLPVKLTMPPLSLPPMPGPSVYAA